MDETKFKEVLKLKKKIFVTGGTGFIGSHIVPKLLDNYEVYALTRYVANRKPDLPEDVNVVYGDLRSHFKITKLIRSIQPDIVLHLGALTPVAYSFEHPQEVTETNYIGTINLASANLSNPNLEKFVFAGTSEEYGNQTEFPIKESAKLNPNQPYAVSKVAADLYLRYLEQATDFPVVIVRPFNTYGRKRNFNFVTESIIYQMLQGKDKVYLGNPEPIRDFLYVEDHVSGYLSVLEADLCPTVVNICTGVGTSIRQLAEKIKELVGYSGKIVWKKTYTRPTEINCLIGDNSLARDTLGWEPKYSLKEGLEETISYIRNKTCFQKPVYTPYYFPTSP